MNRSTFTITLLVLAVVGSGAGVLIYLALADQARRHAGPVGPGGEPGDNGQPIPNRLSTAAELAQAPGVAREVPAALVPAPLPPRPAADLQGDPLPSGVRARMGTVRWHHEGGNRLAISEDRKVLASSSDSTVRVWDAATGKELAVFMAGPRLALSHDGKLLLTAGNIQRDGAALRLWDVAAGKELRRFEGHRKEAIQLAFSPDGKMAASGDIEGTLALWDVSTGKEIRRLGDSQNPIYPLAFAPDGKVLASGTHANEGLRLWDVATGKEVRRLPEARSAVAFAPDSKSLAAGRYDAAIGLWDVTTGTELRRFPGQGGPAQALDFAPDGKSLASAGFLDRAVRVWNVATGQERRAFTWEGAGDYLFGVAFLADSRTIATPVPYAGHGESRIRLWDVETGREQRPLGGHGAAITALAFTPDGKVMVTGSLDQTVRTWDAATGKPLASQAVQGAVLALAPDGKLAASCVKLWYGPVRPEHRTIRLLNVATGKEVQRFEGPDDRTDALAPQPFGGQLAVASHAVFSPDGGTLAATYGGPAIHLWDTATGQERRRLRDPFGGITALAYSPNGRVLATGHSDCTVRVWDEATGMLLGQLGEREVGTSVKDGLRVTGTSCVAFSHDGKQVAGADQAENALRIWDLGTGKEVQRMPGQGRGWSSQIQAIAFSPDDKTLLATSRDQTIWRWDVATGKETGRLTGHRGEVTTLLFAPNGRTLASGSGDATALLWDWPVQ